MERSAVVSGGDLFVGPRRLLPRQVFGQVHHTHEDRIELLESRQVELGQLGGGDLAGLDEPRQVSYGKECEVGAGIWAGDLRPGNLHATGPLRHRLSGGQGMEDEGRRQVVVDLRVADAPIRVPQVALAVQPFGHDGQFVVGEIQSRKLLRRAQHPDRHRVRVAGAGGKRPGEQGGTESQPGEPGDEAAPVPDKPFRSRRWCGGGGRRGFFGHEGIVLA